MTARRLRDQVARFRLAQEGLALIEFSLVLPFAIILYLGGVQLQDGIACNRKVTIATRTIADLIAQNVSGSMQKAEIDSNVAAAAQIMTPYAPDKATIRVTEVTTDFLFRTTVVWSRSSGGVDGYTKGQSVTIPTMMRIPGTYFLYAEITYAYRPSVLYRFVGPMTLRDSLFMLPRNSSRVDCNDC